jgi:hypothetical protein
MNKLIPCYGVGCELRRTCQNYAAVETAELDAMHMSHCPIHRETGTRTMYVPVVMHWQRPERRTNWGTL